MHARRNRTALILCLALAAGGLAQAEPTPEAREWLEKMVNAATQGPLRFGYEMETAAPGGDAGTMKMEARVVQDGPKKMRMEATTTLSMAGSTMEMSMLQVADGETMWMEMQNPMMGGTRVMKMSLAEMERRAKEMGGPAAGGMGSADPVEQIDAWARMFDLELAGETPDSVTLKAKITPEALAEMNQGAQAGNTMDAMGEFVLVVDKKAGFPRELRWGGDPPVMKMRFLDYERLEQVEPGTFSYTPAGGVEVMDLGTMGGD